MRDVLPLSHNTWCCSTYVICPLHGDAMIVQAKRHSTQKMRFIIVPAARTLKAQSYRRTGLTRHLVLSIATKKPFVASLWRTLHLQLLMRTVFWRWTTELEFLGSHNRMMFMHAQKVGRLVLRAPAFCSSHGASSMQFQTSVSYTHTLFLCYTPATNAAWYDNKGLRISSYQ